LAAGISLITTGSNFLVYLHHEDRDLHAQKVGRLCVERSAPFEIEARFRRANGEYRWFLVRAVAMWGPRGKIAKWYGTTADNQQSHREERSRQMPE
jgi:PAS domain S-box-containing protein